MRKKKSKTTYVFIDATNIIYGAKRSKWRMDFEKLAKYLSERFDAKKILYYSGVDGENKKQLKFYEKLQEFGYTLRLVPVKKFNDGRKKADVDSRMTFEMMKYISDYSRAIVLTGDGDYYWVLEYLTEKKKTMYLFGFRKSTAKELRKLVMEKYTDMNDLKKVVALKMR